MTEQDPSQEQLQLPSLFDFLLVQEKLAVEVRRQNKELLKLSNRFQHFDERLDEIAEERTNLEPELASRNETPLLIEVVDLLFSLTEAAERTSERILDAVPRRFFFRKPSWRKSLESVIDGYEAGIEVAFEKMLAFLEDAKISMIQPECGDIFNPNLHRAVECISGGKRYTIAKPVRCGYQYYDHVIRPADVIIYERE